MKARQFFIMAIVAAMIMSGTILIVHNNVNLGNSNAPSSSNNGIMVNTDSSLGGTVNLDNVYINGTSYTNASFGVFNGNMTRSIYAKNLYINSTGVLYTNGNGIYLTGTFDNRGNLFTGITHFPFSPLSYGGSGGGARAINQTLGGMGGYSLVHGGLGTNSSHAQNGGNVILPTLNNLVIQGMYSSGFSNYLSGIGGESYYYYQSNPHSPSHPFYINEKGGVGASGIYIQANKIIAGNISAHGKNGSSNKTYNVYTGGGGGGVVILSYAGNNLVKGSVSIAGGYGANSSTYSGGSGGSGQVYYYSYGSTPPISVNTTLHLYVITPKFVFNGSKISFNTLITEQDGYLLKGNGTVNISDVNTNNYTYNGTISDSINGNFNHKSTSSASYNDSSRMSSSPPFFFGVGPRSLAMLGAGIIPTSVFGSQLFGVYQSQVKVKSGITISTPMGPLIADEISAYAPTIGANSFEIFVDASSGLLLKVVTPMVSLTTTGTNIPIDHTSTPLNSNELLIGGVVGIVLIVTGVSAYYLRHRK